MSSLTFCFFCCYFHFMNSSVILLLLLLLLFFFLFSFLLDAFYLLLPLYLVITQIQRQKTNKKDSVSLHLARQWKHTEKERKKKQKKK